MQPIYIEISDEITTVIERMKASSSKEIALVIPKGAILLQSIVNLKLAKKAAADAKKDLTLVTTDTIGRNLASQVGIPFVTKLDGIEARSSEPEIAEDGSEPHVISGVKIHRYYENKDDEKADEDGVVPDNGTQPIIPREIMRETAPAAPHTADLAANEDFSPITIRPISLEPVSKSTRPMVEVISPKSKVDSSITRTAISTLKISEASAPKPRKVFRRILATLFLLFVLAALAAGGVGAFYLPQTNVTIHMAPQPYGKDITVTAKQGAAPGIVDGGIAMASQAYSVQDSVTVPFTSTGSKDIGNPAKGSATIYNSYSGTPQILPAGSSLKANGLYFITDSAVTVPGATVQAGQPVAGFTTVTITAAASGPDSNLSNVTGSVIAPGTTLYCQIVSTTGGDSKKLQVVTQTDIANGKAELLKKLHDDLDKKLADATKTHTLLAVPNTDEFVLTAFSPSVPAGTEAPGGQVTGAATLKHMAVDSSDLEGAVRGYVTTLQDASHTLTLSKVTTKSVNLASGIFTIVTTSTGSLTSSVPVESIRSQLVGRSEESGLKLVRLIVKDATAIDVTHMPTWWPNKNFPFSNKYLTVTVSHD
jgi:hypothetical protein